MMLTSKWDFFGHLGVLEARDPVGDDRPDLVVVEVEVDVVIVDRRLLQKYFRVAQLPLASTSSFRREREREREREECKPT